jgi:hypothetical protein
MNCGICDNLMTTSDENLLEVKDSIICCEKHREFSDIGQPWIIRKLLGFAYKEPERKCIYCNADLTDEEFNSIIADHQQITCNKHRAGCNAINRYAYIFPADSEKYLEKYKRLPDNKQCRMDAAIVQMIKEIVHRTRSEQGFASINQLIKASFGIFTREQIMQIFWKQSIFYGLFMNYKSANETLSQNDREGFAIMGTQIESNAWIQISHI